MVCAIIIKNKHESYKNHMKNYFNEILLLKKDFLDDLHSVVMPLAEIDQIKRDNAYKKNDNSYKKYEGFIKEFNESKFAVKNGIFASYETYSLIFNFKQSNSLQLKKIYYNEDFLKLNSIIPKCVVFSQEQKDKNITIDYYFYNKEFEVALTHKKESTFSALLSINMNQQINLDYDNEGRPKHEFTSEQIEILNYLKGVIDCSNRDSNRLSDYFLEGKDFSNEDLEIIALTKDININSFKKFNEVSVSIFDLIKNKKTKTLKNIG